MFVVARIVQPELLTYLTAYNFDDRMTRWCAVGPMLFKEKDKCVMDLCKSTYKSMAELIYWEKLDCSS